MASYTLSSSTGLLAVIKYMYGHKETTGIDMDSGANYKHQCAKIETFWFLTYES